MSFCSIDVYFCQHCSTRMSSPHSRDLNADEIPHLKNVKEDTLDLIEIPSEYN